ncbi:GntR family transcriptional regulator [Marinivivus vitaminiproducens]|uniref:GntR family transcriptional regulator n=1 Tax=Marinivivus vitaminiproducens TaxID=3035935 RepID=UPI0027996F2A|nr:GntR family transcriptional regulator [Geminicoccaceae bacterium SCSIO 64248]
MAEGLAMGSGPGPHYTWVRDRLRDDIVNGVFEADQHLVLSRLCQRYRISIPPIREALNQLQVEGLVVLEPNRGARVRRISSDFIRELFEIRAVLEPALVGRSVPHVTTAHIEALTAIQEDFESAIVRSDHAALLRGNGRFHDYIYGVHPNGEAIRLLRQHASVIATMRNRFGYQAGRLERIVEEHHALIRACRYRDAPLAMAIARSHIEHSVDDLVGQMQESPAPVDGRVPGL